MLLMAFSGSEVYVVLAQGRSVSRVVIGLAQTAFVFLSPSLSLPYCGRHAWFVNHDPASQLVELVG